MKKNKSTYNHDFVGKYLKYKGDKKNMSEFVDNSKKSVDYKELSLSLARIRDFDQNTDYNFFGSQWPMSIEELGRCINRYYLPDNLNNEILWVVYQVKRYKKRLAEFIPYKDRVEKFILLGLYEEALECLKTIEEQFGYSIWYFEMKILSLMYQGRQSDAMAIVSEVNEANKGKESGFVSYLIHYIFKRCSESVSAYDYDILLSNKKGNVTEFQRIRQEYFLFKLNMFNSLKSASSKTNLMLEGTNALIDRYLFLQNTLKTLFAQEKDDASRLCYALYAKTLYNFTKDKSYWQYLAYLGDDVPEEYYNKLFLQIIDEYYTGKYDSVCQSCKKYIEEYDTNFDVIRFYCRALIFLKKNFVPIYSNQDCILNKVAYRMFRLMSGSNDDNFVYMLYQTNKNIQSFSIASALNNYIREERTEQTEPILDLLSTSVFDPYLIKLFDKKEDKLNYLYKGQKKVPSSIVLGYNIQKTKEEVTKDERIVDYIRKVDNAHILFNKGLYDECITVMKEVLQSNEDCTPIIQTAVKTIYESYCAKNNERKAIAFYVEWLAKNESYVTKISTSELIAAMRKRRYKDVQLSENTLIFILRNAKNPTDKAFMIRQYGTFNKFNSFDGLIKHIESKSVGIQECFLWFLFLDDEVFNSTTYVKSSREILEAQNLIIHRLIELDTPNKKEYEEISNQLHLQMMVYNGIEKLDESKIFADKDSIIRYETNEARRLFEQFTIQQKLENNSNVIYCFYDISNNKEDKDTIYLGITSDYTDDSLKEICLQIFNSICKPFLKSKFGIGAYLSARIRHGVFESQIYAGFLESNLFLSTSRGVYSQSAYWKNRYRLSKEDEEKLYKTQIQFSKKINELIDRYKEEVLQIKYEDTKNGMFEYDFTDEEKCYAVRLAYKNDGNFESFCFNLMGMLTSKTVVCLERIKKDIRENLKTQIFKLTEELLQGAKEISNSNFVDDFRETVEHARRDMESRLLKMEGWFNFADTKLEDFNLYDHIHVVWGISRKMFPCVNFKYKINTDEAELRNLWIKGDFNYHFSDLMSIFFTNMIKYSKDVGNTRKFNIEHSIVANMLTLTFINDFEGDEEATTEKMRRLINTEGLYSKEGGSGLSKARKIVKFDLKNSNNEIDAFIANGKCVCTLKIDLTPIRK